MSFPRFRFTIFTFLFLVTLIVSCTKIVTTNIGAGLIPPVDGITTKDTIIEVFTKNTGYDTVSVGLADDHVLGFTDDNTFGKTTASLNFQVTPVNFPVYFGMPKDSVELDSVVLCLKYRGTWGDTTVPLKLRVYSMDPEVIFNNDNAYNTSVTFQKGKEITEFNTAKVVDIRTLNDAGVTDSVYAETTTGQLRIRLNKSFGQQLIDYDSASVYQNDSTFYNYLRGLIVEPEQTGRALMLVNLQDTTTHLSLYYHRKNGGDTLTRRFAPDVVTSASSNTILREYQGTDIPGFITSANDNDSLIFMQTSPGGMLATIKIPGIAGLTNRIVHRAEILMYQVPDPATDDDKWFTPPNLFLAAYANDSINHPFAVPYDVTFTGSTINNLAQFGVYPIKDPKTDATFYYNFDITRYVQGIITRKDSLYNLILTAPYNQSIYPIRETIYSIPIASPSLNTVGVGRIRLGGGSNSNYKMKLHIVYSLP